MSEPEVSISLTVPEFVVLDEILRRYSETNKFTIEDKAEQQALWNLQCLLEKGIDPSWPTLAEAKSHL
jgi:hypothetical protein